jgi:2-polyprenyl-3-methyl-5-hydroxy-6-metoxy-1,4-benzoquinol methylase
MNYQEINLSDYEVNRELNQIYNLLQKWIDQEAQSVKLYQSDCLRWSFVMSRLSAYESLLDVGVGQGQFIHTLHLMSRYKKLVGIDIKVYPGMKRLMEEYSTSNVLKIMDVKNLQLSDQEFDIVTCMECLEHLEIPDFNAALRELRRVCGKQLVITVPFQENPLPKYHKQSFDVPQLEQYFPQATKIILNYKSKTKWVLITEDK